MAITKGGAKGGAAKGATGGNADYDDIKRQKAQAKADKKTAGAANATAKAEQRKNKSDIQKSKGSTHGLQIGIWEKDGPAKGSSKKGAPKTGGPRKGTFSCKETKGPAAKGKR